MLNYLKSNIWIKDNTSDWYLQNTLALSSSIITIVTSFLIKGGKLDLYYKNLLLCFQRLRFEEDTLENFIKRYLICILNGVFLN